MVNLLKHWKDITIAALAAVLVALIVGTPTQASFAPSVVRLRQSGTITIAAGTGGSGTGTLGTTLTNVNKAFVQLDGCTMAATIPDDPIYRARIALTNTTTVTLTRGCGGTCPDADTICNYTVMEFF